MEIGTAVLGGAPARPLPSADHEIDACGRYHPGPLLELVRALHGVPRGQKVALVSDDPSTLREVGAWLRREHHALLGSFPDGGSTRVVIRRTH